jgi:hypothetical protein
MKFSYLSKAKKNNIPYKEYWTHNTDETSGNRPSYHDRLNRIIGSAHTYTTHRNKTVNLYKIKRMFIVLVFSTKSVFKH